MTTAKNVSSEEKSSLQSKLDDIKQKGSEHPPETDHEHKNIRKDIDSLEKHLMDEVARIMSIQDSEVVNTSLDGIHSNLVALVTRIELVPKTSAMGNSILKWLHFDTMFARAESIADVGFGTFDWLLEDGSATSKNPSDRSLVKITRQSCNMIPR